MEANSIGETLTQQIQQWETWEKFSKQQGKLWRELSDIIKKADPAKAQKLQNQLQAYTTPEPPATQGAVVSLAECRHLALNVHPSHVELQVSIGSQHASDQHIVGANLVPRVVGK